LISEEEVLVISVPGKRHSGTPFRLCPSEKELPEWRYGTEVLLTTGIHELIKKACCFIVFMERYSTCFGKI
jgi:hypothetical protein